MSENTVTIKGYKYKYGYDPTTQETKYLGPVGYAPPLSEEEFFEVMRGMGGNYIHTLEDTVDDQEEQLRTIMEQIVEIQNYLLSDKFSSGELQNYVNTSDMLLRLDEVRSTIQVPDKPETRLFHNEETDMWEVQVPKTVGGGPTFKGYKTVYESPYKENAESTFDLWKEPKRYQIIVGDSKGERVAEEGYYTQPQIQQLKSDYKNKYPNSVILVEMIK